MAKEPSTLTLSEIKRLRRPFQVQLSEKEKAFLIEAAKRSVAEGENWTLAAFIRDHAIETAEEILRRRFKED